MVSPSPRGAVTVGTDLSVSTWGAQGIARFARLVGFKGELLHDAVALALAASGGADHYAHNPISAPGAERRGLWALRVDEQPDELVGDLFDPAHNAAVARALWERSSGSFSYHPAWINGQAAQRRAYVPQALAGNAKHNENVPALSFRGHMVRLLARADAFGQTLDTGRLPGA